jgi:hypothetical protein
VTTTQAAFWRLGEPGYDHGFQTRRAALVCKRGHTKSWDVAALPAEPLGFCQKCGAALIVRCPQCGIRIRGLDFYPGVLAIPRYNPPRFCDECGEPMPWAGRQERFYQLENILDQQDIDENDRLLVREDLRRLQESADLSSAEQLELWRRIKSRAPGVLSDLGWKIAQTVMEAAIKTKIGH